MESFEKAFYELSQRFPIGILHQTHHNEIGELKDKLHRRNMQIKELKEKLAKTQMDLQTWLNAEKEGYNR